MNRRASLKHRERSLLWRNIARPEPSEIANVKYLQDTNPAVKRSPNANNSLVNLSQNVLLHDYEVRIKAGFDGIKDIANSCAVNQKRNDFFEWAQQVLQQKLGISFSREEWTDLNRNRFDINAFYGQSVLKQFMLMSKEFFEKDPLQGQDITQAKGLFKEAGFHAVGIAPCADGRLAHFVSYVLRIPYEMARRKSHAGSLFDISESVRNWVFIEHSRFREGIPNAASEPTRYLKIAVYHYSKSDPTNQGCAAHGSDDAKAAQAALTRLEDFEQAIENRFGCSSTIQSLLIGINTDDDSLKIHVPNNLGDVCLHNFVETDVLFQQTSNMNADGAREQILQAVKDCQPRARASLEMDAMNKLLAWIIANNFSQLAYVNSYENGCYKDIGHAERFIGIGDGFEEVQLRNLTYYSFLQTVEERPFDVDVGIKIFTGLNLNKGLPIPIIIRCDYDGRVPGSKDRALERVKRIDNALHDRYESLSQTGQLQTFCTLKDKIAHKSAEYIKHSRA